MRVDFKLYNILFICLLLQTLTLLSSSAQARDIRSVTKSHQSKPHPEPPSDLVSITLSTSTHPAVVNYYQPLVREAYKQLGINVEFLLVNEERSLLLLEAGEIDGDIIRTKSVLKDYDSFIPVYLLGDADIYIICQPNIECNRTILQKQDHFLGSVAGATYFEDLLKGSKINLLKYTQYTLLKSSFLQKRVDAYIDIINNHYPTGDTPKNAGVMHLGKIYGYHLLHKKHAHLKNKVAAKLKEVQRNFPTGKTLQER